MRPQPPRDCLNQCRSRSSSIPAHVSGAGVAAGIDMALALTERVHGCALAESLQLVIEYDPQPPSDSGAARPRAPAARLIRFRRRADSARRRNAIVDHDARGVPAHIRVSGEDQNERPEFRVRSTGASLMP